MYGQRSSAVGFKGQEKRLSVCASPPRQQFDAPPHHTACLEIRQRGVLEVDPIQLGLTPPSLRDLERWRNLADLRQRTEPGGGVGENSSQVALAQGQTTANGFGGDGVLPAAAATTTAFLRFRILPAGPWKFSRTFPLKRPRPADWVRGDPSSAGESNRLRKKLKKQ